MERKEAERLADNIAQEFAKNGASEKVIESLKNLRTYFIEIKDPSITKLLRLTYEYLEDNGNFDITLEDYEDEELSPFEYMMQLLTAYDNQYNREELMEYKEKLQEILQ